MTLVLGSEVRRMSISQENTSRYQSNAVDVLIRKKKRGPGHVSLPSILCLFHR